MELWSRASFRAPELKGRENAPTQRLTEIDDARDEVQRYRFALVFLLLLALRCLHDLVEVSQHERAPQKLSLSVHESYCRQTTGTTFEIFLLESAPSYRQGYKLACEEQPSVISGIPLRGVLEVRA